jgi:hypothetical protein
MLEIKINKFNRHGVESVTISRKDNTPSFLFALALHNTPSFLFALALHNGKPRHVLEIKVN